MSKRLLSLCAALLVVSCAEPREDPIPPEEIYDGFVEEREVQQTIRFADRAEGAAYGLPRPGEPSIADLIDVFPQTPRQFEAPRIFMSEEMAFPTDQCNGGGATVRTELPMTIEGVVTLHPRRFLKPTICGQDERHYGSFVLEDDTGGIVVLRDSRVAPFTYGDRVRVTVHAVMFTYWGDIDTRAVLISDIEPAPAVVEEGEIVREIVYQTTDEALLPSASDDPVRMTDMIGRTWRVEGYVHQAPTNANFSQMILTPNEVPLGIGGIRFEGERLECVQDCRETCLGVCASQDVCDDICADHCISNNDVAPALEDIQPCWFAGLDVELVRRNFAPEYGRYLRVTGPLVNDFDREIWVGDTGQIEFLDQE